MQPLGRVPSVTWAVQRNLYGGCGVQSTPRGDTGMGRGQEEKGRSLQAFGIIFWVNQDRFIRIVS